MYLVVGTGVMAKDRLIEKFTEWGVENPIGAVNTIERVGAIKYGRHKILLVK